MQSHHLQLWHINRVYTVQYVVWEEIYNGPQFTVCFMDILATAFDPLLRTTGDSREFHLIKNQHTSGVYCQICMAA